MSEIIENLSKELNNNIDCDLKINMYNQRIISTDTESLISSNNSEIGDDLDMSSLLPLDTAKETVSKDNPAIEITDQDDIEIRRYRSMSDGTLIPEKQEEFEVFPSLPNSVLDKMGLLGDNPKERLNEEELEQKFISLSLAFTIDAATIKDRCERQRRYRDQTETNLHVEIERLILKANRLQPLCIDAETTELLAGLLAQVDLIIRAANMAACSAERFGAVQHENRLAEAVHLMINHVNILKQQRDSARRQLQYTKRVLQDTNSAESTTARTRTTQPNGRVITKRRASIATITQPVQDHLHKIPNSCMVNENRRITRRISELSLRGSILTKAIRPSRLELGVDLVKIREGTVENIIPPVVDEENDDDILESESNAIEEVDEGDDDLIFNQNFMNQNKKAELPLPIQHRLWNRMKKIGRFAETTANAWLENGTSSEMFCFCALMCFSLGIITMGNILLELEFAKHGITIPSNFWNLSSLWSTNNVLEYQNKAVAT